LIQEKLIVKKLLMVLLVLGIAILPTAAVFASSGSAVKYTWAIADLGQGFWGGGSLFADGSAGGNVPFSAGNGQLVFQIHPTSWSDVAPGLVDICFQTQAIKGVPFFPPYACIDLPVTGAPVVFDGFMIRVSPVN
jgi:hypothetical protein